MARLCTLLVGLLIAPRAWCQAGATDQTVQIPDAGHIGFFIGAAIPTGAFGSKSYADSTSGFAKTGLIAGITATYRLNDMISATGMFGAFANNIDDASISKQIAAKYPGYTWTVISDNWRVKTFLGGLSLKLPMQEALLDLSALIGMASSSSPETFLTGSKNGGFTNTAKISSSTGSAFCFMLAATIKKDLSPKICFLLNGGFTHTRPQFMNVNTSFTSGNATVSNFYQDIGVFVLSVGLGYRFSGGKTAHETQK